MRWLRRWLRRFADPELRARNLALEEAVTERGLIVRRLVGRLHAERKRADLLEARLREGDRWRLTALHRRSTFRG